MLSKHLQRPAVWSSPFPSSQPGIGSWHHNVRRYHWPTVVTWDLDAKTLADHRDGVSVPSLFKLDGISAFWRPRQDLNLRLLCWFTVWKHMHKSVCTPVAKSRHRSIHWLHDMYCVPGSMMDSSDGGIDRHSQSFQRVNWRLSWASEGGKELKLERLNWGRTLLEPCWVIYSEAWGGKQEPIGAGCSEQYSKQREHHVQGP